MFELRYPRAFRSNKSARFRDQAPVVVAYSVVIASHVFVSPVTHWHLCQTCTNFKMQVAGTGRV